MLTYEEAIDRVSQELVKRCRPEFPFALVLSETTERPFGWVFYFDSKRFLETRHFSARLAGNGPIIVNKFTAEILFCGTSTPPDDIVRGYEAGLAKDS